VSDPPCAEPASEDNQDLTNYCHQKSVPGHKTKPASESPIPPVSEKLLRKPKIVHFGPHGPEIQAVLPKSPVTPIEPERANETSPNPEDLGLSESARVEDIDDLVPDHNCEPTAKSREIKKDLASLTHDVEDISDGPVVGQDTDTTANTDHADGRVIERLGESMTVISYDQDASENVVSAAGEAESQDSFQISDRGSSHKTSTQQLRLQMSHLADNVTLHDTAGAKGPQMSQDPTRQSIGISSTFTQK